MNPRYSDLRLPTECGAGFRRWVILFPAERLTFTTRGPIWRRVCLDWEWRPSPECHGRRNL